MEFYFYGNYVESHMKIGVKTYNSISSIQTCRALGTTSDLTILENNNISINFKEVRATFRKFLSKSVYFKEKHFAKLFFNFKHIFDIL